jgi:hypothetical protein
MIPFPPKLLLPSAFAFLVITLAACGQEPGPPVGETFTLTVQVEGSGTGTVTSTPAGINVSSDDDDAAAFDFPAGTSVTLTASPASGHTFAGWSGACSGTAACIVTMDAAKSVTASFAAPTSEEDFTLTVSTAGAGTGTVTSTPAGIDLAAGAASAEGQFAAGTVVTLTATPAEDSRFSGWTGDCVGLATCQVTMDGDKAVTAVFGLTDTDVFTRSFSILQGSDDAEEYLEFVNEDFPAGSVHLNSSDLDLTFDVTVGGVGPNGEVVVGLRYAAVDIPQGAVIESASITFTRRAAGPGSVTLIFEGEAVDDAQTFVYGPPANRATFGITSRPTTAASVQWTSTSPWGATATTPDLASIVQEIVDRDGWQSGNALAFIISSNDSDANNYRRADAYEQAGGATAPVLNLSYRLPEDDL